MTGNLLQSDIDLARRLLQSGESDDRVFEALCLRRVDPMKARRAVYALREGVDVRGDDLDIPEVWLPTAPASDFHATAESERGSAVLSPRPKAYPWVWISVLGLFAAIAGILLWVNREPNIHAASDQVMRMPEPALRGQSIAINIDAGKVIVAGVELHRENALAGLNAVLGSPSRRNRMDDVILYVYDDSGIVLYSPEGAGKDSLVVYFEPMGGANGVQKAFSGTVFVQGRPIVASTGRKDLEGIPNLGLKETVTNVFAGDCGPSAISFDYLKTRDRLTLVQIDLN